MLIVKDKQELGYCEKAGRVCSEFTKRVIKEVEDIIDSEKEMRHSDISAALEKHFQSPAELTRL